MTYKALVTGGAGFIGSHLVDAFLQAGHDVVVLDNLSTGDLNNLKAVQSDIDFHQGDLRNLDDVRAATHDCDLVVHLGALGSVPRSFADPLTTHEVNATGTLNTLIAARDNDVGRVIFSSSSSVFGSNRDLPKIETMSGKPLSPYAATKSIGEDYSRQFATHFDLDVVTVRFFNVFGPRQAAAHVYAAVIPKFLDAALHGRPVEIHGDGTQSRDFTYISNVVDGLQLLGTAPADDVKGQVFHLACGASVSLLTILEEIDQRLGQSVARTFTDPRPGDIKDSLADITKLRSIGYAPTIDVAEGVGLTLDWFRAIED